MPRRALCACTKCAPWLGVPTAIWLSAVWTQWVRSGNAVTAQWGLLGRHDDAVRTQWGRIWSPQERRHILQFYGNAMKGLKKHWQISEFQFPKPYFQPFCSIKYRNQANTTYFSMVVCLRCLLHHILSLIAYTFWETGILCPLLLCSIWWVQILFVCLYTAPSHYHHCANLSEDIELIKCLSDIFFQRVSEIKHILSVIHYTIYGAVCFQFANLPCGDWDDIYFVLLS